MLSHMVNLYGNVLHSAIHPSSDKLKNPFFNNLSSHFIQKLPLIGGKSFTKLPYLIVTSNFPS